MRKPRTTKMELAAIAGDTPATVSDCARTLVDMLEGLI